MKGSYYVTNLVCYYLKKTHSYGLKLYLKYCYKYLQTKYEDIQYKNKKMKTVSRRIWLQQSWLHVDTLTWLTWMGFLLVVSKDF